MRAFRSVFSGFLIAYGAVAFMCFFGIDDHWIKAAPAQANEALGLVYRHNEHGSYTYLSAFQATALALLFFTSIPMVFLGALISPKTNLEFGKLGLSARWDVDLPRLHAAGMVLGAVGALLLLFVAGPHLVAALNQGGFAMSLG